MNFTSVPLMKLRPCTSTTEPVAPRVVRKLAMVGPTVKLAVDRAVPPGVVTDSLPVVAVAGTVAVMVVAELTEKLVAATELNLTAVAPSRPVPVMVTTAPGPPDAGLKDVRVGTTLKVAVEVAVPPGVVTLRGPVVAVAGTVAVMLVAELTVKLVALTPLNRTAVAPVKPVPVRVTLAPTTPLAGENEEMVGAAPVATVKLAALAAVPPEVVTLMGPVVAPADTVAVICWPLAWTEKVPVATPLKETDVVPLKWLPEMVTLVPTGPLAGENEEMAGGRTVKLLVEVAVPPGATTLMGPVVAPGGT